MKLIFTVDPDALPSVVDSLRDDGITVVFTSRTLGTEEVEFELGGSPDPDMVRQLVREAVVSYRLSQVADYDPDDLRSLTRQQLVNYVENQVTDVASAREYLKKLSVLVLYLYKRIMEDVS